MPTLTDNEQALHDFIIKTYPKRGFLFSTSWSTCTLPETPEETLVQEYLNERHEGGDWLTQLPQALFDLAVKAGAHDDSMGAHQALYSMFLGDAMRDLLQCHLRDF